MDRLLLVVVPVVALWVLLLFAPASADLAIAERLGFGALVTLFYAPLMWLRILNR
jgi:hypothetical protein